MDISRWTKVQDLSTSDIEDAAMFAEMADSAEQFLLLHRWCKAIRQGYLVDGAGKVIALFYYEIDAAPPADDAVWVIVGDIPPLYLDLESCPDPASAVSAYIFLMQDWVDHVKQGKPVDELAPVLYRESLQLRAAHTGIRADAREPDGIPGEGDPTLLHGGHRHARGALIHWRSRDRRDGACPQSRFLRGSSVPRVPATAGDPPY